MYPFQKTRKTIPSYSVIWVLRKCPLQNHSKADITSLLISHHFELLWNWVWCMVNIFSISLSCKKSIELELQASVKTVKSFYHILTEVLNKQKLTKHNCGLEITLNYCCRTASFYLLHATMLPEDNKIPHIAVFTPLTKKNWKCGGL